MTPEEEDAIAHAFYAAWEAEVETAEELATVVEAVTAAAAITEENAQAAEEAAAVAEAAAETILETPPEAPEEGSDWPSVTDSPFSDANWKQIVARMDQQDARLLTVLEELEALKTPPVPPAESGTLDTEPPTAEPPVQPPGAPPRKKSFWRTILG